MVGSGPGGLLYPYVVRGYRKSTSPAQEELLGHRRGRLGRQVVGLPPEPTELRAGDRRVDPFHRRLEIETPPGWLQEWSGQIGAALKDGLRETPGLDRLCTRERDGLPHLHGDGARPVRRALLQLPARANAESPTHRASVLAEERVPGMMPRSGSSWISFHAPA
jgi:hypothetical protein